MLNKKNGTVNQSLYYIGLAVLALVVIMAFRSVKGKKVVQAPVAVQQVAVSAQKPTFKKTFVVQFNVSQAKKKRVEKYLKEKNFDFNVSQVGKQLVATVNFSDEASAKAVISEVKSKFHLKANFA